MSTDHNLDTKDAPEVTGYGEPYDVTPSKMVVNVLQDGGIQYTNFQFFITIRSEISSFQIPLSSRILHSYDCLNSLHQEQSLDNLK